MLSSPNRNITFLPQFKTIFWEKKLQIHLPYGFPPAAANNVQNIPESQKQSECPWNEIESIASIGRVISPLNIRFGTPFCSVLVSFRTPWHYPGGGSNYKLDFSTIAIHFKPVVVRVHTWFNDLLFQSLFLLTFRQHLGKLIDGEMLRTPETPSKIVSGSTNSTPRANPNTHTRTLWHIVRHSLLERLTREKKRCKSQKERARDHDWSYSRIRSARP